MTPRRLASLVALSVCSLVLPLTGSARAASAPVITIKSGSVRIQVASASLAEAIDAFSKAAGFKVTYDGPRPTGMLFNAEVDTPSVSQTLSRLLEGQNLNYAMLFDLSGTKVATLLVLGPVKAGGSTGGGNPTRPQPFATPRVPRNDMPPVDDDPNEAVEPQPTATPEASPSPSPQGPPRPLSPFGPRPFGSPIPPRPSPTPST